MRQGGSLEQEVRRDLRLNSPPKVAGGRSDGAGARVHFKPISGEVDQAAGLMVRVLDTDNYYIARANALEDNVRLYKVFDGDREQFAGVDAAIEQDQWQTLGLRAEGDRFEVSLNGDVLFSATDDTFSQEGKVGLWTKADSLTHFDDFIVRRIQ